LAAAAATAACGTADNTEIEQAAQRVLAAEPRARVEYVAVFDPVTLRPPTSVDGETRIATAVRFGDVRLIDNRALGDD
jgi:pantothenate synthetase